MAKVTESTNLSSATSSHWLLKPHEELLSSWKRFEPIDLVDGFSMAAATPDRVRAFVEFENHARKRKVGPPLLEHLERFGSHLAFVCLYEGQIIAIQRYRLYHEFDSTYRTLLAAYGNVMQRFRSLGIGRSMLKTAAIYFRQQGAVEFVAGEVWPENKPAMRYTVKAGYEIRSRMSNGKVILTKRLKNE